MRLFSDIVSRRSFLEGGLGVLVATFFEGCTQERAKEPSKSIARPPDAVPLLAFEGIPISKQDTVVVPHGYGFHVVNAWGDPILPGAPAFEQDASQSAAEQATQAGMFHDGMEYFPLPKGSRSSKRAIIAIN